MARSVRRQKIESQGLDVEILDAKAFAALIKEDTARWRKVIQEAGIQPE